MKKNIDFNETKNSYTSISKGISTIELLVDVELLIHIIPEDQSLLEEIKNAFETPKEYPSLGRREDLATILEVKEVEVFEEELEDFIDLNRDISAYIPIKYIENESIVLTNRENGVVNSGTRYKLPKNYELINYGSKTAPKIFRKWKKVDVLFTSRINAVEEETIFLDSDRNLIFAI